MHTHVYTYIDIFIDTYIHTYMYTYTRAYICASIHTYLHTCIHIHLNTQTLYTRPYSYIKAYTHTLAYVHATDMYLWWYVRNTQLRATLGSLHTSWWSNLYVTWNINIVCDTTYHMGWLRLVDSLNYRSLLQKSSIKATIFCKRILQL